jgi:hypothetical protein
MIISEEIAIAATICFFLGAVAGNLMRFKRKKGWFFVTFFFFHWFVVGIAIASCLKCDASNWFVAVAAIVSSALDVILCLQLYEEFLRINKIAQAKA